mmetsp:Transcript_22061/g.62023  ORF Transcript_22061/g.62023 Transcript_22061/m.62023 type:complete len:307 (+) Transcript_22061:1292-2212(+)
MLQGTGCHRRLRDCGPVHGRPKPGHCCRAHLGQLVLLPGVHGTEGWGQVGDGAPSQPDEGDGVGGGDEGPHGQRAPGLGLPRPFHREVTGLAVPARRGPRQGVRHSDLPRGPDRDLQHHLHAVCPAVHVVFGRAAYPRAHHGHPSGRRRGRAVQGRRRGRVRRAAGQAGGGEDKERDAEGLQGGGAAQDGERDEGVPHDVQRPPARPQQADLPRGAQAAAAANAGLHEEPGAAGGLGGRHGRRAGYHGVRHGGHGRAPDVQDPVPAGVPGPHHSHRPGLAGREARRGRVGGGAAGPHPGLGRGPGP